MHNLGNTLRSVCLQVLDLLLPVRDEDARLRNVSENALLSIATRVYAHNDPPCIAPLPYDHALVRSLVHAAKYRANERASTLLGRVLGETLKEEIADRRMFGAYLEPLVIPVPLHDKKYAERGFNQAERIANAMVAAFEDATLTVRLELLVRARHTETQTKQRDRRARTQNMRGVFAVPQTKQTAIQGRDILLVDDVVTTGATLADARRALFEAGARDVLCVAVAH